MIALSEIIERFEPEFFDHYRDRLLPSQRQALAAMKRCRTRFAPRMSAQCTACANEVSVPHSCGHRACPHCQHHEGQVWLQRQLGALVPATYFLITFTLPAQLRGLAWCHQRVVYALLMQCAWQTLATFTHNDRKLGGTAGAVGVLHTHNRRLDFHPHVHMVMPAAALDAERKLWRTKSRRTRARARAGKTGAADTAATPSTSSTPGGGYLFNHKALAKVFRAKLLDALAAAGLTVPGALPAQWVVDCRCVGDGSKALLYLGRYLYRGVIQENDILRCEDGRVTFRYRDAKTGKAGTRTLAGEAFLWLVIQHVLPRGLRRSRNFGFLHPNSACAIRLLQVLHLRTARPLDAVPPPPTRPTWRCTCGQPMRVVRRGIRKARPGEPGAGFGGPAAAAANCRPPEVPDKPQTSRSHSTH